MKKKEAKALKEKLIAAVKKVLKANNTSLTTKIDNAVKKAIRQLVKKNMKKIVTKKAAVATK
jgi:NCAIR mutase (PurE)-related protein